MKFEFWVNYPTKEEELSRSSAALNLRFSFMATCDDIDICHVAFMKTLLRTDPALLITMGESGGPEEMLLKIKGSGDVKVGSRVTRHRRLRLQAAMSGSSGRLGSLIYLLTDFTSRHLPARLTGRLAACAAYASQVNFKGRGRLGVLLGVHLHFMEAALTDSAKLIGNMHHCLPGLRQKSLLKGGCAFPDG